MNFPKKPDFIFIDIDGTLVNDDRELSDKTIEVIKEIDKKDIPVVLTSGRMNKAILPFRDRLELKQPIIAFGGGLILDENQKPIFEKGITVKDTIDVYDFAKELNIDAPFNYYYGNEWYTDDLYHPLEQWDTKIIGHIPIEKDPYELLEDKDRVINKCLFVGEPEVLDNFIEPLREKFKHLTISKSNPRILEVYNGNINKAEAIKKVVAYYNKDINNIVGIGDNFNDIDMLETVGHPILMQNAPEELKAKGFYVTAEDNNHDGLAKVLNEIFLNK